MTREELYSSILECIETAEEEGFLFEVLRHVLDYEDEIVVQKINQRLKEAIYEWIK